MGIGGGGDSSDTDLEAVLEVSLKAVHRVSVILCYFRVKETEAVPLQIEFTMDNR